MNLAIAFAVVIPLVLVSLILWIEYESTRIERRLKRLSKPGRINDL